jgi:hypothetical protein
MTVKLVKLVKLFAAPIVETVTDWVKDGDQEREKKE